MAGALQSGWDRPANPRVENDRTIDRYAWKPQAEPPRNDPQRVHPAPAEVVVGVNDAALDDEDERPVQEILRDACRTGCTAVRDVVGDFLAGWFGAVHLQHFSADDMEVDVPKSAAAKELSEQALLSGTSSWKTNFSRINPKVTAHPRGWSGAHREVHGWSGQPERRPEATGFWKHTYGVKENEAMVTRQHLPIFSVLQCMICLVLWLIFHWRDGTELGGLESIWPDQTDMALQWDCEDFRSEAWRWWTYQFSHIGISHVGFNCVMTLFFGIALEGVHGWLRMFLMFNIGVFGGACCCFVFDPHSRVVGMSGGCYALIGMHFGDVLMNFTEMAKAKANWDKLPSEEKRKKEVIWRKMIISPKQKIAALVLLVTLDTAQGYLTRGGGVSLSAHAGGFVAGFLVCIVIGHNLVVKGYERFFWAAALITGGCLIAASMVWGMRWPPRDIFEQVPWCWGRQIANVTVFGDNKWHCVRCPDQACIARWHIQRYIATVTDRTCQNNGGWKITDG